MHAVTNIQKYSIHDGDGIRTTVFFKGCGLRCHWCHNPETQRFAPELQIDEEKCVACGRCLSVCPAGAVSAEGDRIVTDRSLCTNCGKCTDACAGNFRTLVGREYSLKELVQKCVQDLMFYEESGGGVTLSGGEVMAMDKEYIRELCRRLHREGISVTIDTCGQAPQENYEAIFPYVDTWLYDVKVMDEEKHRAYIGTGNEQILSNLKWLARAGARIYIRVPVIREVNGDPEAIGEIIDFLKKNAIGTPQVNLLPYHSTGSHKYAKLGRSYPGEALTTPSEEEMDGFRRQFLDAGFPRVMIGG